MPLIKGFHERYPDITIGLSLSDSIEDLINEGFDLAIRFGEQEDSSFVTARLGHSKSVICAHKDYVTKHGRPNHPSELAKHDCLVFRRLPGRNPWHFERSGEAHSVCVGGPLFSDNGDALLSAVLSAQGIVMLPYWMVAQDVENGTLVPLLEEWNILPGSSPISAIYPSKRNLAPKVRVFIDYLQQELTGI